MMGEYTEMMLNETCCEGCGEYIGGGDGFPAYCSPQCAADRGAHSISYPLSKKAKASAAKAAMAVCDECGKRVKATGLWQHKRDAHKAA